MREKSVTLFYHFYFRNFQKKKLCTIHQIWKVLLSKQLLPYLAQTFFYLNIYFYPNTICLSYLSQLIKFNKERVERGMYFLKKLSAQIVAKIMLNNCDLKQESDL